MISIYMLILLMNMYFFVLLGNYCLFKFIRVDFGAFSSVSTSSSCHDRAIPVGQFRYHDNTVSWIT